MCTLLESSAAGTRVGEQLPGRGASLTMVKDLRAKPAVLPHRSHLLVCLHEGTGSSSSSTRASWTQIAGVTLGP